MKVRKLISILTLCIFVLSSVATGAFAQNRHSEVDITVKDNGSVQLMVNFKDMKEAEWALKHVMKMKMQNIIAGYQDGTFKPNKPVTRAEAVVLTMRAAGLQEEIDQTVADSVYLSYRDAKDIPFWAQKAVYVAVKRGYLSAAATAEFQPNKPATREWVVTLMAKALDFEPMDIQLPFKDADRISPDIAGYVAAVVYDQLISGYPDGNFKPNKPVTRAEIAVMLGLSTDELQIPGKIKHKTEGTVVSTAVYNAAYSQGNITIDVDGKAGLTMTLPVAKDALIYVGDKPGALADIGVGAKVEVISNEKGMAVYIEAKPKVVTGVVQAVYGDKIDVIEFETGRKHRYEDPVKATYTAAANVAVVLNGAEAKISDLKSGDKIKLILDGTGKAAFIKASRFVRCEDKVEDKKKGKNVKIIVGQDDGHDDDDDDDDDEDEDKDKDKDKDED